MKESFGILYGLCLISVVVISIFRKEAIRKTLAFILAACLGGIISFTILCYVAGGPLVIIEATRHWKEALLVNDYAIVYQAGPWYILGWAFWMLAPISAVLFCVGAFTLALSRRAAILLALTVSILFAFIVALIPYSNNLRYVSPVYIPFYLAAGAGFWYAAERIQALLPRRLLATVVIAAALLLIAGYEYNNYELFIKKGRMNDLSVGIIREVKEFGAVRGR